MHADSLTYDSIDDCLGPAEQRYFGTGYRRVRHRLEDIRIDGAARLVRADGGLDYPTDWSTKSPGSTLVPHLSTIDTVLFGMQLAEVLMVAALRLDADQRRRSWLRGYAVKAGSQPTERLESFPVEARLTGTEPVARSLGDVVSTVDCLVGTLRLRLEIEHEAGGGGESAAARYASVDDVLGPAAQRLYGTRHVERRHEILGVRSAPEWTAGTVRTADADESATDGISAAYGSALSALDCLIVFAQMSQVLMYAQDGISRERTGTLWLREMTVRSRTPYQPTELPFGVRGECRRTSLVRIGDDTWHTGRLAGGMQSTSSTATLAFRLLDAA